MLDMTIKSTGSCLFSARGPTPAVSSWFSGRPCFLCLRVFSKGVLGVLCEKRCVGSCFRKGLPWFFRTQTQRIAPGLSRFIRSRDAYGRAGDGKACPATSCWQRGSFSNAMGLRRRRLPLWRRRRNSAHASLLLLRGQRCCRAGGCRGLRRRHRGERGNVERAEGLREYSG